MFLQPRAVLERGTTNSCFSQRDNNLEEELFWVFFFFSWGEVALIFLLSSKHHPVDGGKWSIRDVESGGQPEPHFWHLHCVLGLIWHTSVVLYALALHSTGELHCIGWEEGKKGRKGYG